MPEDLFKKYSAEYAQANLGHALKSLNHGKQTKWNQLGEKVPICRGSLAWLGRQTHNLISMRNLEFEGAKRLKPEVTGSNPVPETELASVSANGTIRDLSTPQKSTATW